MTIAEIAAVLTALRILQVEIEKHGEPLAQFADIFDCGGQVTPLTAPEIDALHHTTGDVVSEGETMPFVIVIPADDDATRDMGDVKEVIGPFNSLDATDAYLDRFQDVRDLAHVRALVRPEADDEEGR